MSVFGSTGATAAATAASSWGDQASSSVWPVVRKRACNQDVHARIAKQESKSASTIRNIVNSVGSIERWLKRSRQDTRTIETIPPRELNDYLVDFFTDLTKPNGDQYDPDSFTGFRSYLDRFLKEKNYPCSISKSPEFAQCQHSFRLKRKLLNELNRAKRKQQYGLAVMESSLAADRDLSK